MAERTPRPTRLRPVDPHNQYLQKALEYNHLSAIPANWRQDTSGFLKQISGDDDPTGVDVAKGPPIESSFLGELGHALPYFGAAVGMGALGALGGAGAGAAGASAGAGAPLASSTIGSGFIPGIAGGSGLASGAGAGVLGSTALGTGMATLPAGVASGTSAAASAGGGNVGIGSMIKNFLLGGNGSKGLDPTTLLLGGLSMLGPTGIPDPYKGSTTNPEATLSDALSRTHGLMDQLQKRGPAHLRMPAPISIPGLPFQIGGGLGTDPSGQGGSFKLPSAYDEPGQQGPSGNPFSTADFGSPKLLKGWADRLTHGK